MNNCVRELLTLFQSCRLVALVEVLQKRKLKHNKRPQSQPHALENITIALDAIQDDGIKLVNIGKNFEVKLKEHYKLKEIQIIPTFLWESAF